MEKTARCSVVAGFALLATLIAALLAPSGAADAVTEEDECTLFVDWDNHNVPDAESAREHQYFVSPHPNDQVQGDWQFVRVVWADGTQHPQLARGWTLDYNWAHHTPCSSN